MSMDRRDFLKTTALGSSLGAIVTAGLLAEVAG
ncbi:MAG: twin-arginine translocation signal domain-containing protein, partial [Deltaproteobacteria bacterium]|nr:twin-arginine translocation signal domain-containing protein [Deltaproteobacteria bacterium]